VHCAMWVPCLHYSATVRHAFDSQPMPCLLGTLQLLLQCLLLLQLLFLSCAEGVLALGSYSRSFPCTLTRLRSTSSPAKSFSVHLTAI
jgi:hypothetical protein